MVALAEALGVPRGAVTLVRGAASRKKVVEIAGDALALEALVAELEHRR
ncbi:MAG: hypothetical protein JO085_05730 [Acidimicrobiia bacterium]|nr:hypothetical protein [Acidimicrobiia bacterium]